jgi:hypothetical protein
MCALSGGEATGLDARVSGAVAALETTDRYFSEPSMEADSSMEVREVEPAVKRAAEWDPDLRCANVPCQVCH